MKTDNSGIITTEFFTGRCPVRCEMCFVNFGEGGSSVPFTIYARNATGNFQYATCQTTLARLRKDKKPDRQTGVGALDWVEEALCGGGSLRPGDNNIPRHWEPVVGVDKETRQPVMFWSGMSKEDYKRILKPLGDEPGLYSIPKVPEAPWFRRIEATRAFNGQWLPSVLRVNSMSDSSVAPTEFIARVREVWGEDCFFNTNVHALKRFPANMRSGLYHKVVVTANPGLQRLHAGLERYKLYYPKKTDVAADPDIQKLAYDLYGYTPEKVAKLTWEELYGFIQLRLGGDTMKGDKDRPWHFFKPALISDVRPEFAKFEQNIKFYRVRALPTIQPHVDKFAGHPVVYTVIRFKTIAQSLEFARKYDIECECIVKSKKDKVVCDYYGVPCRIADEGEPSMVRMRSNDPLNGSPRRGQWTELTYSGNFFRAGKSQMGDMQFVCDRASQSCKACGLCATLDGTVEGWANPRLAQVGLVPKEYGKQASYVADANGLPVATGGVVGRLSRGKKIDMTPTGVQINRTQAEMDFFAGPGEKKFWSPEEAERARKAAERQAKRQQDQGEQPVLEQNPVVGGAVDEIADPAVVMLATMESFASGRRRNPNGGGSDILFAAMADSLKLAVNYGNQGEKGPDDYWVESWNTHEEVATMVAYVYWWLMVIARNEGLGEDDAFAMAEEYSYEACGQNMFEYDFVELSLMYHNRSYWNDQFGPTH